MKSQAELQAAYDKVLRTIHSLEELNCTDKRRMSQLHVERRRLKRLLDAAGAISR